MLRFFTLSHRCLVASPRSSLLLRSPNTTPFLNALKELNLFQGLLFQQQQQLISSSSGKDKKAPKAKGKAQKGNDQELKAPKVKAAKEKAPKEKVAKEKVPKEKAPKAKGKTQKGNDQERDKAQKLKEKEKEKAQKLKEKERKEKEKIKEQEKKVKEKEKKEKEKEKEKENEKKEKEKAKKLEEKQLKNEKPKRPLSAHLLYVIQNSRSYRQEHAGVSQLEATSALAKQFSALSDEEKEPYTQEAANRAEQYQKEKEDFERKHPKKPATGYSLFMKTHYQEIRQQNPEADFLAISKIVAKAWKELGEEEKQNYLKPR